MSDNEQDQNADKGDRPQDPIDPMDYASSVAKAGKEDISLDAALSADAKKKEKDPATKEREKKFITYGVSGVFAILILMMVYSCQPAKGSMAYGICSTFLELQTPYPQTIRHINLEGSRTAVRIYFTTVDPFGEFKQEVLECKFGADEQMGMRVTEITRNRKQVDRKIIEDFNKTLPTIMASDPYRIAPPNWENQLLDK